MGEYNMKLIRYFSIVLILLVITVYFMQDKVYYQVLRGETMGTTYMIKIRTDKEDNMLHSRIKKELESINKQMSVFEKDSEINSINNAEAGEWIDLSPEMSVLLNDAYKIYRSTKGSFDPTVGKLVDLWGFGANKTEKIPSQEEIDEVLAYSGFNRIKFSDDFSRLKKENSETFMNLSAIAKGYGVDRIADFLKSEGYKNFLVEIGGEIYASGKREKGTSGWNIGIMDPKVADKNVAVATLKNNAVATSGDYFNYFYSENAKYSHTISMKDGRPVKNNLTAVTVFADSCTYADAYATAFVVMGDKEGLKYANRNKMKVVFFVNNPDGGISVVPSDEAKNILEAVDGAN